MTSHDHNWQTFFHKLQKKAIEDSVLQFQMLLFASNLWNLSGCQTRVSSMPNKSSVDEIRLRLLDTVELLFLKRIPVWIQAFSEHSQISIVGEELRSRCHKVPKSSSGTWLVYTLRTAIVAIFIDPKFQKRYAIFILPSEYETARPWQPPHLPSAHHLY